MNKIYKIISEEIDRLIEEGKDPVEIINYKFRNVPEEIRTKVIEADPTKKKSYSQWTLTLYLTSSEERESIEYFIDNGNLGKLFNQAQENKLNVKDLKSINDIRRTLYTQDNEKKYDILYDSPEWQIIQPQTAEAAKKLGQYTEWCTAGSENKSYWDEYSEMGPIFINIDKRKTVQRPVGKNANGQEEYKTDYVKYQFLFEYDGEDDRFYNDDDWDIGMLCNADDDNLAKHGKDLPQKIDMPEEVEKFYNDMGYYFNEYGSGKEMRIKEITTDGTYLGRIYQISIYAAYNPQNGEKELMKVYDDNDYDFMEELGEINDNYIDSVGDEESMNSFIIMKYEDSNEYYFIYYDDGDEDVNIIEHVKQYIIPNDNSYEAFCIAYDELSLIDYGEVYDLLDNVEGMVRYNSNNVIVKDYNNEYYVADIYGHVTDADEEEINFYNQNTNSYSMAESIKKEFFKKYNLIEKIIKNNQTLL